MARERSAVMELIEKRFSKIFARDLEVRLHENYIIRLSFGALSNGIYLIMSTQHKKISIQLICTLNFK